MNVLCRLGIHRWSSYRRPTWTRVCSACGKSEQHPYYYDEVAA